MKKRARVVTITSRKGGVGKTVCTSLLARYFTEQEGREVLVVDLDGRGGITSVLHDQPIRKQDPSIAELLAVAGDQGDTQELFRQAVIQTGLEHSKHWQDQGGALYLLPAKPSLDSILAAHPPTLLKTLLDSLPLPEDSLVLIDTGSDGSSVLMGVAAADVVFLPLKYSRQDVHPTVETLRTIILEQKDNGTAALGGLIVNQAKDTHWEQTYQEKYTQLFQKFKSRTNLLSASEEIFIPLDQSRIIQRGLHMDWSFRDSFLDTAMRMAEAVHAATPA